MVRGDGRPGRGRGLAEEDDDEYQSRTDWGVPEDVIAAMSRQVARDKIRENICAAREEDDDECQSRMDWGVPEDVIAAMARENEREKILPLCECAAGTACTAPNTADLAAVHLSRERCEGSTAPVYLPYPAGASFAARSSRSDGESRRRLDRPSALAAISTTRV